MREQLLHVRKQGQLRTQMEGGLTIQDFHDLDAISSPVHRTEYMRRRIRESVINIKFRS